jgi:hypothetical protein
LSKRENRMNRIFHATVGIRPTVLRRVRASSWGVYVNEGPPEVDSLLQEEWSFADAEERRLSDRARSWFFIAMGGVLLLSLAAAVFIAGFVGSR